MAYTWGVFWALTVRFMGEPLLALLVFGLCRTKSRFAKILSFPILADFGQYSYAVYILTNRPGGTLYCGVTNDLLRRLHEHRSGAADGFTRRYKLHRLVWFEAHTDIREAIQREKRIKKWRRAWKVALIEAANPRWDDLTETLAF